MNENVLGIKSDKHYDLVTLETNLVRIEPAGRCIRVGIKNGAGGIFSYWEPTHPFTAPPPGVSWPKQDGWHFTVEVPSPELTRGIFKRDGKRHVLTLQVTDPTANPKPVKVSWE